MKKLTTEEFIAKARIVHGDKYDYSKVDYKGTDKKVIVICPIHGEFLAIPHNFLQGHNCPACSGRERVTREIFISRSDKVHAKRYDYSRVDYKGLNEPVCILCPIHGEFWQKPAAHMRGNGCPKCFGSPKSTTKEFIKKARQKYGNRYDYSKVDYQGNKVKVCIVCPEHGEWWVTPNNFLRGSRCPGCFGTPKYTNEEFITMAKEVHGEKYDYSQVQYDGLSRKVTIVCPIHGPFTRRAASHLKGVGCPECSGLVPVTKSVFLKKSKANHAIQYDYSKVEFSKSTEKVCIICPKHGEFWQNVYYHMRGGNCPKCAGGMKLTTEIFIDRAKAVHGEKYDYSKVEYKNYSTKVCIICPDHGEFWQTPNNHLFGAGCPVCPQSNLEGEVRQFLESHGIEFEQERSFEWLRYQKKLFLDFYLPEYSIAIECQGGQHFFPVDMYGGEKFFEDTVKRDAIKRDLCKKHGILLLYFSNARVEYPYPVIETFSSLLESIQQRAMIEVPKQLDMSRWINKG